MVAARNENKIMVSFLLRRVADINIKDYNGWTALMKAAINNKESMISLFIIRGADIIFKNNVSIAV